MSGRRSGMGVGHKTQQGEKTKVAVEVKAASPVDLAQESLNTPVLKECVEGC